MIHPFSLLVFIITLCFICVQSDSLPPLYKHGCVILANQKIYCYGGANRQGNAGFSNQTLSWFDSEIYNHHVYLDVSKPLNVSSANTQWQPIPPPSNNFQLEPRSDFAMVNHNDTGYTIIGGSGPSTNHGDQSLINITTTYDSILNAWKTIKPSNTSAPTWNMSMEVQTFGVRAVKVNSTQFFIAGGVPPNNNTIIEANTTYVEVDSTDPNWGTMNVFTDPITSGGNLFPETSRIYRPALATSRDGNVYIFGGAQPFNVTDNRDYMTLREYYVFDDTIVWYPFKNQSFNTVKASNPDSVPTPRELHTATSIPNTSTMLLYGGVLSDGASRDFCYTYDTASGIWTIANFTNGDGAGRRYGHQVVMVGNDLLYIIGGIDITNTVQNDVHILNVTSMTWLNGSYTNTYDQMNGISSSSDDNSNNNNGNGSSSLSGGAIAGIVIGCVAALALGTAAAVIFYMQRKRKELLASGAAPAGFAPTTPSTTKNTKEYNTTNTPGSPINDGSTTLYSSNPAEGTSGHVPTPGTIKPSI